MQLNRSAQFYSQKSTFDFIYLMLFFYNTFSHWWLWHCVGVGIRHWFKFNFICLSEEKFTQTTQKQES